MRSTSTARAWHTVVALGVGAALVLQLLLVLTGGTDANSGESGDAVPLATRLIRLFSFFTIQSNVLVLVSVAALALVPLRDGPVWRVLRLDGLIGIVVTGLVYELALRGLLTLSGGAWWADLLLHVFAPWMTLLGWLLFGPRPRISWPTVGLAMIWPFLWLVYTFVHGAVSHWYPYPFLDVSAIGYPAALRNTGVVLVLGVALASVYKLLDDRLPTLVPRKSGDPRATTAGHVLE